METDKEPLKLKNNVAGTSFTEPIKELQVPSRETPDGNRVPVTPVIVMDPVANPIIPFTNVPWGRGAITYVRDATADDSDKILLTVPIGKVAVVNTLYVNLITTATVGTRNPLLQITDGTNTVFLVYAGTQAASLTVDWNFGAGLPSVTTGVFRSSGLPTLYLPAGYVVRFYDSAAIDPAADDMITVLEYNLYDV